MSQTSTQSLLNPTARITRLLQSRLAPILVIALPIILVWAVGATNSLGVWLGAIATGLCLALVGVGTYITFRVLDFPDLTIDGTFTLGASAAAVMIVSGLSPWLTIPVSFLLGAVFGAITAIIATRFRIHSLLASIIVATGLISINLRVMGKSNIPLLNSPTIFSGFSAPSKAFMAAGFGNDATRYADNVLAILLAGAIVLIFKLLFDGFTRTEIGMAMRATGDNGKMIKALGRNQDQFLILGVAISNGMVGLSGAVMAQFQGFSDVNMGLGLIITGLASVILGETILRPRNIGAATLSAVVGMILYRVSIAAALTLKFPLPNGDFFRIDATDVKLATSLLVLITLWLANFSMKRRTG